MEPARGWAAAETSLPAPRSTLGSGGLPSRKSSPSLGEMNPHQHLGSAQRGAIGRDEKFGHGDQALPLGTFQLEERPKGEKRGNRVGGRHRITDVSTDGAEVLDLRLPGGGRGLGQRPPRALAAKGGVVLPRGGVRAA